jgi:copper homeostasis protein
MQKISFEVCANSLQSALAAEQGGADRIELCAQLDAGGITPSAATIKLAVQHLSIQVFVLIRPRSGDFVYDDHDFQLMKEDILIAKDLGASGVVAGMLNPNGEIDIERTTELVKLSRPMQFTFHRAFDRTRDAFIALEDVIKCGANHILTSGQARSAFEGKELLKALAEKAKGRINILAGAGIDPDNVSEIIDFTGVSEVHASCSIKLQSRVDFASALDSAAHLTVTDVETVKQIVALIKNFT